MTIWNIQSEPYGYRVYMEDDYILVGGHRSEPCLILTKEESELHIQDLFFRESCSTKRALAHGDGSVRKMVRVILKWLLSKFPEVEYVTLMDKSFYENLLLPEMKLLTEGQTWYQKHFGAEPYDDFVARAIARYQQVYREHGDYFKRRKLSFWENPEKLREHLNKYRLKMASGLVWRIPRRVVEQYPDTHIAVMVSHSGGGRVKFPPHKFPVAIRHYTGEL